MSVHDLGALAKGCTERIEAESLVGAQCCDALVALRFNMLRCDCGVFVCALPARATNGLAARRQRIVLRCTRRTRGRGNMQPCACRGTAVPASRPFSAILVCAQIPWAPAPAAAAAAAPAPAAAAAATREKWPLCVGQARAIAVRCVRRDQLGAAVHRSTRQLQAQGLPVRSHSHASRETRPCGGGEGPRADKSPRPRAFCIFYNPVPFQLVIPFTL